MDNISKITDRIIADAKADAEGIKARAEKEAADVNSSYKLMAREECEAILEKGKADAKAREERIISAARLEAGKQLLSVKQELVAAAFDRALDMLTRLPEDRYTELLIKLAVGASRSGVESVILSSGDRSRYGKAVINGANDGLKSESRAHKLKLSADTAAIRGGLVLKEDDIEINCALETLIEINREALSTKVANALFEPA